MPKGHDDQKTQKRKAHNSSASASSSISTNSVVNFSHLPSLIQKRVVEVTNEAALEAPGIAREMSRRGRERSEKEAMKNKKLK